MKYSININQAGIADAGFSDKTDLVDWALIDYIFAWQNNPAATRIGSLVWISYKHLISEMPLLGLKTKQAVSARMSKLKALSLIVVEYDSDKRLYAGLTGAAHSASVFRASCPPNATGVHENGQGVHDGGQGGVHDGGHTAVNQFSAVNQYQREQEHTSPTAPPLPRDDHAVPAANKPKPPANGTRLPPDWVLSVELGEWALAQGLSRERIRQEADKFADYWKAKPGTAGRKLDWAATWRNWIRRATETTTGGPSNAKYQQSDRPRSAVDRVNAAISARAAERERAEALQRAGRVFDGDGDPLAPDDRALWPPLD